MALYHWDDPATKGAPWRDALAFLADPVIAGQPYVYRGEADLHWSLGGVLQAAGVVLHHEVQLAPGLRIDFTSGRAGIEVKTGGGPRDTDAEKQLGRYSRTGRSGPSWLSRWAAGAVQVLPVSSTAPNAQAGNIRPGSGRPPRRSPRVRPAMPSADGGSTARLCVIRLAETIPLVAWLILRR